MAGLGLVCLSGCKSTKGNSEVTLKDAFANKFLMGVAINDNQASGRDSAGAQLIIKHFNSVAPENCMKSEVIHPEEGRYDFTQSDRFVAFGEKYNMDIIGHTLIWHSQLAPWFCVDENGKNVSKEVLTERMKEHITTVVSRYKGKIKGWDVVNEAFEDDGSYRQTKFYEILGEDIYLWPFSLRMKRIQMLSCIIMTTPWRTKAVETQWSIWLRNYKQKAFGLTLWGCRDISQWNFLRWRILRLAC